ncbi:metallophosphoesterase [Caldibacillus lycopersici]|uniref:Metallophosphoesterase n=1 Tax=Perspicuibacillus lycopersici TaxID=1325689 RepID=A0AAE3IRS5_9BACI|nr:metallophosphoesterase [Perspicuibacillus lycopersici]MCU9612274.1 metallophosphoesterase [Perspicuibacillus lycopersici]
MKDKKISRRSFLRKAGKFTIGTAITGFFSHYYIKNIEPKWIETTRFTISHPLIPQSFHNKKIVQFSDTHLGFHFDLSQFKQVINKISKETPDIIIFSGDLVDNLLTFQEIEETIAILSTLSAPYGKFAVYGNHDHGGWGSEKYQYMMKSSNFSLLQNEAISIKMNNEEEIILAGIDDAMLGKPDLEKTFRNLPANRFTLCISHAPDIANEVSKYPIQFQISGHTHGGQVQIPFIGPLITPPYGKNYFEGFYYITEDFTLYVNRGLGTTRLPYRFLSRPEITFFTLQSEKQ